MKCSALLLLTGLAVAVSYLSGCSALDWGNNAPTIKEFAVNGTEIGSDGLATGASADAAGYVVVAPGDAILAICKGFDENDDNLTYAWTATTGLDGSAGPGETVTSSTVAASGAATSSSEQVFIGKVSPTEGVYSLSCAVSDGRGGVVSRTAHIRATAAGLNPPLAPGLVPATAEVVEGGTLDFVCRVSSAVSIDDLTFGFFALHGKMTENDQTAADRNLAVYTAPLPAAGQPAGSAAGSDTVYCVVCGKASQYGVAIATVTVKAP
ncbi:hypothetical protein LLH03_01695 [bacterium]|nr:hypothetical protein [bacterium]